MWKHDKRHQWQLVPSLTFVGILPCSFLGFWASGDAGTRVNLRIWVDEQTLFFTNQGYSSLFFWGCIIRGIMWVFEPKFLWILWKILIFPKKTPSERYSSTSIGMLLLEQSPVQPSWTKGFNQMVEYQDKNEQRSALECVYQKIYIYIRHMHVASCIMSRMYPHAWCIRTGIFVFIPSTAFYIVDLLNICI